MLIFRLFFILISIFGIGSCSENICSRQESCQACIQKPQCVWCSGPPEKVPLRCRNESEVDKNWCREFLTAPTNNISVLENNPVQTEPAIQFQPQKIKLKLRLGEPISIPLKYQQANDFPVDLYYLMDLSNSMKPHKDKLSALGSQLASAMRKITKNFRLGFGSYVDKVAIPFVNTLSKTCKDDCELPYSYRHRMSLSENDALFKDLVDKCPMSTNVDNPEGGFDALTQAMVCTEEIGWRKQARRIIILSTDAPSHLAGDGKLAGIYLPYDEKCHLKNISGILEYTEGLRFDYPSLGQINKLVKDYNMNIIFAVTGYQRVLYEKITQQIRGSSFGILDADSKNVIKLVMDHYESLTNNLQIVDSAPAEYIQVEMYSKCYGENLTRTSQCKGIRMQQPVEFLATITALQCPLNADEIWKHEFKIQPQGLEEALQIELEVICGCNCDKEGHPGWSKNSIHCTNFTMECGVCKCPKDRTGRQCQCLIYDQQSDEEDPSLCKKDDSSEVCSGLGVCKCGVCDCIKRINPNEVISGQYCQCDNFSCTRAGLFNLVCSGSDHGQCVCGKCVCHQGWSGPSCSCSTSKETCAQPGDSNLCSNHGTCECGKCQCNQGYSGHFCQNCTLAICVNAGEDQCSEWVPCIKCHFHNKEKLIENGEDVFETCRQNVTCPKKVELVESISELNSSAWRHCRDPDEKCTLVFAYSLDGEIIHIQSKRECPLIVDLLGVVLGVIGSTIFIGLLFLIAWKVITSIHDNREFAKFEKERAESKWERDDNPLYKPSTSTFTNPTFEG